MGTRIVIKVDRKDASDAALYLVWTSERDSWVAVGTRKEIRAMLVREEVAEIRKRIDADLDRAAENGSTDRSQRFAWWEDDEWRVGADTPHRDEEGYFMLRRADLPAYATALNSGDNDAARALLVFHPDEEAWG